MKQLVLSIVLFSISTFSIGQTNSISIRVSDIKFQKVSNPITSTVSRTWGVGLTYEKLIKEKFSIRPIVNVMISNMNTSTIDSTSLSFTFENWINLSPLPTIELGVGIIKGFELKSLQIYVGIQVSGSYMFPRKEIIESIQYNSLEVLGTGVGENGEPAIWGVLGGPLFGLKLNLPKNLFIGSELNYFPSYTRQNGEKRTSAKIYDGDGNLVDEIKEQEQILNSQFTFPNSPKWVIFAGIKF